MRVIKKRISSRFLIKYLIIIVVFACVGATVIGLWSAGVFLPRWIVWEYGTLQDASGEYEITLARKKVRVRCDDNIIWTTTKDIKVQKALSSDIDRDGQDELVLLCWRKGHYGDVKPIWVEEDEVDWVQHIFVYEFGQGNVHAKWMSSYIGKEILDITTKAADGSTNLLCLTDTAREVSEWAWDSWGFVRVDTD